MRDLILFAAWAAYNAAWLATITVKYTGKLPPGRPPSPKLVAKMLAALAIPSIMLLLFPVSRGSVLNQALGLTYNEAIRFHRLLGQWVLLLISTHGLMYWFSWCVKIDFWGGWGLAVPGNYCREVPHACNHRCMLVFSTPHADPLHSQNNKHDGNAGSPRGNGCTACAPSSPTPTT